MAWSCVNIVSLVFNIAVSCLFSPFTFFYCCRDDNSYAKLYLTWAMFEFEKINVRPRTHCANTMHINIIESCSLRSFARSLALLLLLFIIFVIIIIICVGCFFRYHFARMIPLFYSTWEIWYFVTLFFSTQMPKSSPEMLSIALLAGISF